MAQNEDDFEKLHKEHLLILTQLKTIQTTVSLILRREQTMVTPELEDQVRFSELLAQSIDKKVPDQE